jgi:peptidoglycan/xylan/chitin deacetylase (PgdA/CDA1 family)
LNLAEKEIVLTFDDGPLPGRTDQILDALKAECVTATFFLIGKNALAHPDLVKRELAEGHTIGNHTWSHPPRTLRGITEHEAIEEITRGTAAILRAEVKPDASAPQSVSFFRFPGFADTAAAKAWLDSNNIVIFGADLWASDWLMLTPDAELTLVMKRLNEAGHGIILFHDTRASTAVMMPAFLRRLKHDGFKIVHVAPGKETPVLRYAPQGWSSETEAILRRVMPRLLKLPDHPVAGDDGK